MLCSILLRLFSISINTIGLLSIDMGSIFRIYLGQVSIMLSRSTISSSSILISLSLDDINHFVSFTISLSLTIFQIILVRMLGFVFFQSSLILSGSSISLSAGLMQRLLLQLVTFCLILLILKSFISLVTIWLVIENFRDTGELLMGL